MPEQRIDVHAHFIPPFYRRALQESGHVCPDGMPAIPPWTPEGHLALMASQNISTSILSISSPGTSLSLSPTDPTSARNLTRQCNEYASSLADAHPGKFTFWASLPLPDVYASLEELAYALDVLGASGVTMETNHHGVYLGDERFRPVMDELNRRRARVFVHPTSPCVSGGGSCGIGGHVAGATMGAPLPQYPNPMFEFMFETSRCLIDLFLSQTISRCPDISFIIPHAGGALPPIIDRFTVFSSLLGGDAVLTSRDVKEAFARQFHFDVAGVAFPEQIHGILRFVGKERLLYGSDYPFTAEGPVELLNGFMEEGMRDWTEEERQMVLIDNARRMLADEGAPTL